jgi:hypothetical protein
MCNVNSMMYLISDYCPDDGGSGGGPGEGVVVDDVDGKPGRGNALLLPAAAAAAARGGGTALDDARRIAARCAWYRSIALQNVNEFNYKRALKDIVIDENQQQQQQQQQRRVVAVHSTTNATNTDDRRPPAPPTPVVPARPPHHPEYTPMSLRENYAMAKIHGSNYALCLAAASCPHRAERMVSCWASVDARVTGTMERHGMGRYICSEERKALERCVGGVVQRAMKDILG